MKTARLLAFLLIGGGSVCFAADPRTYPTPPQPTSPSTLPSNSSTVKEVLIPIHITLSNPAAIKEVSGTVAIQLDTMPRVDPIIVGYVSWTSGAGNLGSIIMAKVPPSYIGKPVKVIIVSNGMGHLKPVVQYQYNAIVPVNPLKTTSKVEIKGTLAPVQ